MKRKSVGEKEREIYDHTYLHDRKYYSYEHLSKKQKGELEKRIEEYTEFIDKGRISYESTLLTSKKLENNGFALKHFEDNLKKENKFYCLDPWEETSLIVVNKGKLPLSEGFRLLVSHNDSPCLRVKPKPVRVAGEFEKDYYLGVRLSCVPHGGILNHQWAGRDIEVRGYFNGKDRILREIKFPALVSDLSCHVDNRVYEGHSLEESFLPEENLEIQGGFSNVEEMLGELGLESMQDLTKSRLYGVPTNLPVVMGGSIPKLITGYGHDNRVCTFSAIDAITKTQNQDYTSIVWVTDNEEVGDTPPSGANGLFLDLILDNLLERELREAGEIYTERTKRLSKMNSRGIIADVTISPVGIDYDKMDADSAPKIGHGYYIYSDPRASSNSRYPVDLIELSDKLIHNQPLCYQVVGDYENQDNAAIWMNDLLGKDKLYKGIGKVTWAGVGVGCSHSHSEVISPADEFWLEKFYERFFKSKDL